MCLPPAVPDFIRASSTNAPAESTLARAPPPVVKGNLLKSVSLLVHERPRPSAISKLEIPRACDGGAGHGSNDGGGSAFACHDSSITLIARTHLVRCCCCACRCRFGCLGGTASHANQHTRSRTHTLTYTDTRTHSLLLSMR